MNPFIFMVARAFSSRQPIADRYADHERYVKGILSTPVSRVERVVEQYFQQLHERLFEQEFNLFLGGADAKSWREDEPPVPD